MIFIFRDFYYMNAQHECNKRINKDKYHIARIPHVITSVPYEKKHETLIT